MSEPEQGVGAILRTAREARGLSVQEAAQQLRLMNRQVTAMEDEDFASLGQPVFARGFVRNYARMLGLDAATMLQLMGGAQVEPVEVTQTPPLVLPGKWFTSRWLITGMVLLLLATVLPIGLYAWLSSDTEDATPPVTRNLPATTVSPPATPALDNPSRDNPSSVVSATPADENAPAGLQPSVDAEVTVGATEASTAPPPIKREMRFEFASDAWLDVKDGTGQSLHRQMNLKGSNLVITGQPPLELIIGNAAQVRMSYNGRPLDLMPYINANVARFSLEE
ncbi:MAG: RodZ domain-containing protein [Thiobacillus sp.]